MMDVQNRLHFFGLLYSLLDVTFVVTFHINTTRSLVYAVISVDCALDLNH
jgi:hypothetical protein